jgi:type IV pilus assembly protein PilO
VIKPQSNPFSTLNLHIAGVALFAVLNIFLGVRLLMAFRDIHSDRDQQIAQKEITLTQLKVQASRLDGLPDKVGKARTDADDFYARRIAADDSSIIAVLGDIAVKSGVRFTRASYTYTPAIPGLTEARIDANVSGEYTGVMHFINGLERDKTFFLIDGLTLTGQQGGMVNLRLKLTTYQRSGPPSHAPPASVAELGMLPVAGEAH